MALCGPPATVRAAGEVAPSASEESGIPYEVAFQGVPDAKLETLLREVSESVASKDRLPLTEAILRRRAEGDVETMRKALRAWGYFKSEVGVDIDPVSRPAKVDFVVNPGPPFMVRSVDIRPAGSGGELPWNPSPTELGFALDTPYRASEVLGAQRALLRGMADHGHPLARLEDRTVVADFARDAVSITYIVDAGPQARFGRTDISGLEEVEEDWLRQEIPWERGDVFDASLLTRLRREYLGLGIFSLVDVDYGREVDESGEVPVSVKLTERDQRTIRAGVYYNTDFGIGARLGWEHRNYFGRGERLSVDADANQKTQGLAASLRKPAFLSPEQSLVVSTSFKNEDVDAYTGVTFDNSVHLERKLTPGTTGGLGLAYTFSDIRDSSGRNIFGLVSVPGFIDHDASDDLLDPSLGWRGRLEAAPYTDTLGSDAKFLRYSLRLDGYLPVLPEKRFILASRARIGQIFGASRFDIPAIVRFYSGGGGSVRGYPYQTLGPLDGETPEGGRSLLECSFEARFRLPKDFGLTLFLDGGSAYADSTPDFGQEFRWGTGIGLRYYTSFAPIRLDVAFPLNRRDDIDDMFQVYIGLGQAF